MIPINLHLSNFSCVGKYLSPKMEYKYCTKRMFNISLSLSLKVHGQSHGNHFSIKFPLREKLRFYMMLHYLVWSLCLLLYSSMTWLEIPLRSVSEKFLLTFQKGFCVVVFKLHFLLIVWRCMNSKCSVNETIIFITVFWKLSTQDFLCSLNTL